MPEEITPPRRKRTVAQQLRTLLATEGYRPRRATEEEDPTAIYFKVEGNTYLARAHDSDPDFVALCTGYTIEEASKDEVTLLRAAMKVQNETKVAKVYLPPNLAFVEFQLELFLGGKPLSPELLDRSIATLRATARKYHALISEPEQPRAQA